MEPNTRIGFIGMGNMAKALCQGFIVKGLVTPDLVTGSKATTSGMDSGLLKQFKDNGVRIGQDNAEVIKNSDIVFLCVKPHILPDVLKHVGSHFTRNHLIISVAAGLTIETIQKLIGGGEVEQRIVRAMPNTPVEICEGATVYTMGAATLPSDEAVVEQLFSTVGLCSKVTAAQFDVALNGPGPAFVFLMIEALADGGVMMGLPRAVAMKMAAQTVKGAAALQLSTGMHPGELKDKVCSPGGTTIRGVQALEAGGLRAAVISAVQASTEKAWELGGKK